MPEKIPKELFFSNGQMDDSKCKHRCSAACWHELHQHLMIRVGLKKSSAASKKNIANHWFDPAEILALNINHS